MAVEVNYTDPQNGWQTSTELVEDPEAILRYGRNLLKRWMRAAWLHQSRSGPRKSQFGEQRPTAGNVQTVVARS
ncbi:hypothetical protein D4M24_19085 [Escherichia coli]|nr:hypothetical protein D4M24_19085 [Escherichia coli]